mgnify:CR=1 FL=1
MADCLEPADEDCHWHSTGIGPMRIGKMDVKWLQVWRRKATHRRDETAEWPCGFYLTDWEANMMAHLLARVPEEWFLEAADFASRGGTSA